MSENPPPTPAVFSSISRANRVSTYSPHSVSPLFSGTGWTCCWSARPERCGSPPGCGRRTRSSSVPTAAAAGSWLLSGWAWSRRPGCRSGWRAGSGGNPAKFRKMGEHADRSKEQEKGFRRLREELALRVFSKEQTNDCMDCVVAHFVSCFVTYISVF